MTIGCNRDNGLEVAIPAVFEPSGSSWSTGRADVEGGIDAACYIPAGRDVRLSPVAADRQV